MQIILDISANTHKNDEAYYKRMIDELAEVDTRKHEVILKWQLFEHRGDNIRADRHLFRTMAEWAFKEYGYKTTASVFDLDSLIFLKMIASWFYYYLPFIKIANDRSLDWLIGEIPRKYQVYKSVRTAKEFFNNDTVTLWCVSEYPANINDYPPIVRHISDHTVGLKLYHRNNPIIWEKHYKLEDSTGLDAGDFAITPQELKEIL
jgi:sialic acid synthase SpsE